MKTKIDATYFQIYPPTEFYNNWELHFYDESVKHYVIITIKDISRFKESIDKHNLRSKDNPATRVGEDTGADEVGHT